MNCVALSLGPLHTIIVSEMTFEPPDKAIIVSDDL